MGDSVSRYCALAFVAMAAAGVAAGCTNALWMRKIPAQHRGSVFGMTGMLSQVTLAIIVMGGGLVCDHLLRPALAQGGFLALNVGEWFDAGKRGPVALLFVGSGMLGLLICLGSIASHKLRRLDLLVPDHDAGSQRDTGHSAAAGSSHGGAGMAAAQPAE
jgi:diaminobutyrate-2-oxoglutarate transaminase